MIYHLNEALNLIEISYEGQFDSKKMLSVIETIAVRPDAPTLNGLVWDFRTGDLSTMDMNSMREVRTKQETFSIPAHYRIAAVFKNDVDRLVLDLWRMSGDNSSLAARRHFVSMNAARDWVAQRDATT